MCGIAGVLYRDGRPASGPTLARMASQIAHRGPDGSGERAFEGAGLAHRRLAILDLTPAAAQPMGSDDGRAWISFNGEIYNFAELRRQLEQCGHRFRSSGDTEVVLKGYLEWGVGVIRRLDGMFALALWDVEKRELLLARDRTGKKPLYIYQDEEKLVFGSEIKAILEHPDLDTTRFDPAIAQFLTFGYSATPDSFYTRIKKLPPASSRVISARHWQSTAETYWSLPTTTRKVTNLGALKEELRELFFAAVRKRLISDVPLGAFLSGGIDSTLVVAAMAHQSAKPVKTFCIGFADHPQFDESKYARLVASRYGTDHVEMHPTPEDFSLVERLSWHYDEPFGDSSAIPTYLVSKHSRKHVAVALTGDGGDEVFAGYFRAYSSSTSERIPRSMRVLAGRVARRLPASTRPYGSALERARRLALQLGRELPDRVRGWLNFFTVDELRALLVPEMAERVTEASLGLPFAAKLGRGDDVINNVLALDLHTYLLDDINVKVDRASMAVSLETRAPFLDTKLIEFAFSLPGNVKLKHRRTKWILKEALGDLIPPSLLDRPKMGFGIPIGSWFRSDLKQEVHSKLLADDDSALWTVLRRSAVERVVTDHERGFRDYTQHIWAILMLDLWLSRRTS